MKQDLQKWIAAAAAAAMTLMQLTALPSQAFPQDDPVQPDFVQYEIPELLADPEASTEESDPTEESEPTEESTSTEGTDAPETQTSTEVTSEAAETTSTSTPTEEQSSTATTSTKEPTSETADTTSAATQTTETDATATVTETAPVPTSEPTEITEPEETTPDPAYEVMPDFSRLGAIDSLSAELTQEIAERIFLAIYHHETTIDFNTLENGKIYLETDAQSLKHIFYTVVYSTRYGILVDLHYSYTYTMPFGEPHYISSMRLTYAVPDFLFDAAQDDVFQKLDAISSQVDPAWSAPEKALFFHEYFAVHFNYDYESCNSAENSSECFTAYGLLINDVAVCQGYAWLYNILLNEQGIESYMVTSAENNHAWNILRLDGYYYHVDCTYDDFVQNSSTQIGQAGQVDHTSFLKTHTAMISSGHACNTHDWVLSNGVEVWKTDQEGIHVPALLTSNRFTDAFWNSTSTAIYPYQDGWLVKEPDPGNHNAAVYNLYRYHADSNECEMVQQSLLTDANPWYSDLEHTRIYSKNYSVCVVDDGIIYYTTGSGATVMAVVHRNGGDPYDNIHVWFFNLDEEQAANGSIFGMKIEGDTLYYQVAEGYRKAPVEYKCSIADFREQMHREAGLPHGDLNGDNQLDVLDIIGMNRYLAGADTVEDSNTRKRLDLVQDGVLDVFDLAMLKKRVLDQS